MPRVARIDFMKISLAVLIVVSSLVFASLSAKSSSGGRSFSAGAPEPTPATRPRTVSNPGRPTDLGPGASLHGKQLFPPDNPWNQDISKAPVDPNSNQIIQ